MRKEKSDTEEIIIRPEVPDDYRKAEDMVREAFWDVYKPGCNEHLIVHKLRKTPACVKELDLVACEGERIVGLIFCPKAKVIDAQNREFTVLSMIVGVHPSHQKKGIGTRLIRTAMAEARLLGFKGIVIFGNPDYYHRFGFRNAKEYGIRTSEGENLDPFMAAELSEKGLRGVQGRFYEDTAYHTGDDELERFEKVFPCKEKHVTATQLK